MAQPPDPQHLASPGWQPPAAPSWAPAWNQPAGVGPGVAQAPEPARRPWHTRPPALALAGVLGMLVGVVGSGVLVAALFVAGAEDVGREIGDAMAPTIRDGITEGFTDSTEDTLAALEAGGWAGEGAPASGAVAQFEPTAPGDLGTDPVLDAYADECFAGDMRACDDLYFEAPPLSPYEQYSWSCGGRVKAYSVASCTELD